MEYFGDYGVRIPRRIERNVILLNFMEAILKRLKTTKQEDKIISLTAEIETMRSEVEGWLNWAKQYVPDKVPAG